MEKVIYIYIHLDKKSFGNEQFVYGSKFNFKATAKLSDIYALEVYVIKMLQPYWRVHTIANRRRKKSTHHIVKVKVCLLRFHDKTAERI